MLTASGAGGNEVQQQLAASAARAGRVRPPLLSDAAVAGANCVLGYNHAMSSHEWLPEAGLGPDPALVREVLAIRPGGLAAVVHAVPALRHLRATYPDARISVAAAAPARELLQACPYVDRILDLARPSEALIERFDIAVSFAAPEERSLDVRDVNAGFRAAWRRHGEASRGGIQPDWPMRLSDRTRMLRLAWLLGGASSDAGLGLWPRLVDRNGAARLVADVQRPLALVHVGAGQRARRWPAERWSRVIDLVDAVGLAPVVVGTRRDTAATDTAVIEARSAPLVLVGQTGVGELAGLLERAALFVGGDSGPAALAGALGVRSVVVAPGSPLEHVARPGIVDLVGAGPCERCGELACGHPPPPAHSVPLEPVLAGVTLAAATAVARWRAQQIA